MSNDLRKRIDAVEQELRADFDRQAQQPPRPADCAYCTPDHKFYGPGWVYMSNGGPIAPCPVCNDGGATPRQK